MRKFEIALVLAIVAIVVVMVLRILGSTDDNRAVVIDDARHALRELPYNYRFRDVNTSDAAVSVVAGTAYGPNDAVVHFGAAFGRSPDPVPLPGKGVARALELNEAVITTREGSGGDRGKPSSNRKATTAKQQTQVDEMTAQISAKLCQAAGEDSCEGASEKGGGQEPSPGKSGPVFRTIDQGPLQD